MSCWMLNKEFVSILLKNNCPEPLWIYHSENFAIKIAKTCNFRCPNLSRLTILFIYGRKNSPERLSSDWHLLSERSPKRPSEVKFSQFALNLLKYTKLYRNIEKMYSFMFPSKVAKCDSIWSKIVGKIMNFNVSFQIFVLET